MPQLNGIMCGCNADVSLLIRYGGAPRPVSEQSRVEQRRAGDRSPTRFSSDCPAPSRCATRRGLCATAPRLPLISHRARAADSRPTGARAARDGARYRSDPGTMKHRRRRRCSG